MSNQRNFLFDSPKGIWQILKDKKAAISFSGGKDSLALLHYLFSYNICELTAVHVNHHLRGYESEKDELFCRNFCNARNISFKALSVDVRNSPLAKTRGVEHAARVLRYGAIEYAASNCDYILTAHTRSDQLESFFVDIITGVSLFTLGGIDEQRGKILRPMLNVTSQMTEEYLKAHGLLPVSDSSNKNENYIRNYVRRHYVKYLTEKSEEDILKIQSASRMLKKYYSEKTVGIAKIDDIADIDLVKFEKLSATAQSFVLGNCLNSLFRAGNVHITLVRELMKKKNLCV